MKFSGNVDNGTRNRGFDYGGNPDNCLNPAIFLKDLISLLDWAIFSIYVLCTSNLSDCLAKNPKKLENCRALQQVSIIKLSLIRTLTKFFDTIIQSWKNRGGDELMVIISCKKWLILNVSLIKCHNCYTFAYQ